MVNDIIHADTIDNTYQISLSKNIDLFGAISYNINVIQGDTKVFTQVLTDIDIAKSVYDGLIKYYSSDAKFNIKEI